MEHIYKTKPFEHQREEVENRGKLLARGLFWEQGTGKTKPVIDSLAQLYRDGEVDALLVIAPNGVHRNWVSDEIPRHMPDDVAKHVRCHIHYSSDAKYLKESYEDTLNHKGLAVLVISYNAIWTERGKKYWKQFLQKRKCFYVLDESQRIKNPGAKMAKRVMGSNKAAKYKRVLSGTPIANSPFDLYNQLRFLKADIWYEHGIKTFSAFKQYFGIWENWTTSNGTFPVCVAYKNIELLNEKMLSIGTRVTKEDVLDLPPKLYSKQYVELTTQQKRLYKQLKDDYIIETLDGEVSATLAIVRLLRFQQIICGYLPASDDDDKLVPIEGGNPRLTLLGDICSDLPHKVIIWARFTKDIEMISQHKAIRDSCVIINGSVTGPARGDALDSFQKGDTQFLIANPQALSTGVTLHAAKTVIYYSNTFNWAERVQSEDRAHRIGLEHPVHYIDLVAQGTVDTRIVECLRNKLSIASQITGDTLRDWI